MFELGLGNGAGIYSLGEIIQGVPMKYGLCWKTIVPERTVY